MSYKCVPVTAEHIETFLARIRPQDKAEVEAGGMSLASLKDLLESFLGSPVEESFLALVDSEDTLAALGGINPVGEGFGAPWFLCTVDALTEPKEFYRAIRDKSRQWEKLYPKQIQRTWVPNTLHARLIRRLGYTVHRKVDSKGFAIFTKGVDDHV